VNSKIKANQNSLQLKQNVTNAKRTFYHLTDSISKQPSHIFVMKTQTIAFAPDIELRIITVIPWIELSLMIRKIRRKLISAQPRIFYQGLQNQKEKKQRFQLVSQVLQV